MCNRVSVRDPQAIPCCFIVAVLLTLFGAFPSAASALQGDVNGDGMITLTDALLVQNYLEGQAVLDAAALARADMNNDGEVDIADVIAIRDAIYSSAIFVNVSPVAAQWTLSGPAGFTGNGQTFMGAQTFTDATTGPYTWSGLALTGYDTPASRTQTLAAQTTVTFNAAWMSSEGASLPVAMLPVPAGTFTMGARDDETSNTQGTEGPRHQVTLSAYQIGKYLVTNRQYCDVLNWALAHGYLKDYFGEAYAGGDVYAAGKVLLYISDFYCNIQYSGSAFSPKRRTGAYGIQYSMATHPVDDVTWYGSAIFCNWLSEREGLTSAYNTTTWDLLDTDAGTPGIQFTNGYRLPTEAEWERAAGWNGTTHWIYGFQSDTLLGKNRCNYWDRNPYCVNPLGLTFYPQTSPVGWFNGVNISPNGLVQTINSPSPVGAYDMSGNVREWCHDWEADYNSASQTDPIGPGSGTYRILRGGSWSNSSIACRSACRTSAGPVGDCLLGFRVARAASSGAPGTVSVNVSPNTAQWTLSGPAGYAGNGQTFRGDQTFANAPAGDYTWTGLALTGYDTPASQTQTLTTEMAITFNAIWMSSEGASLPVVMLPVPAGTFIMGARDDETSDTNEGPRHQVTLSAYQIGKYEVTNGQYCELLNWALAKGYVKGDESGGAYTHGDVYAAGEALLCVKLSNDIQYSGGAFSAQTRTGAGIVQYSMATHPVVGVTWYGSVVFCNWLSEKEGLIRAYNTSTWRLVDADAGTPGIQFTNGYRLPTEAEWERAAGWNGTTHWIYGFQSDSMSSASCNYCYGFFIINWVNPLGFTSDPYTSPVGWFNGVNISPNGLVQTINSQSPVGAYDMSGNVWEWCHDWYGDYSSAPQTNPIGL
ncbi:MAG: SUMF1/EgtB/PvdO family nonheme iron enzyme, partial [Candidatus Sumerlaeota bacterium]|nr:SUMF1/EgtB/PvdO family nonheme iron enzyme [Candidatus Sumerlaeota bacterium]